MIHGFLMIAANAGFVATAASTPSKHNPATFDHDRTVHRNKAIASIGIGTVVTCWLCLDVTSEMR